MGFREGGRMRQREAVNEKAKKTEEISVIRAEHCLEKGANAYAVVSANNTPKRINPNNQ